MAAPRLQASRPIANATVRNFAVDETNEQATRRDDACVERIQRQR